MSKLVVEPTELEVINKLREILRNSDLHKLTRKQVREKLQQQFGYEFNGSKWKNIIKDEIKLFVENEQNNNNNNNDSKSDDDNDDDSGSDCMEHDYGHLYEGIEGKYECYKYKNDGQNGYHFVTVIKQDNGTYLWKNLCTQWTLTPTNKAFEFKVGKDCVYYDWGYHDMKFKDEQNMVVCGYGPHNELFQKVRKFSDNYFNMNEIKNNNDNNNNSDNNDVKENHGTEGCDTEINNVSNKSEMFTWKGGKCAKAKQIGRVSILDNFIVSFSLVIHGKTCDNWESILCIGNNDAERSPGFWLYPKSYRLHVRLSDIHNYNTGYDPSMELQKNKKYNIKFECINKTVKLHINDKLKTLCDDVTHITRFRVPIWCGNTKWMPANATISDLKIESYM